MKSSYSWIPENVYFKKHPLLIKINNFLINNSIVYLTVKNSKNNIFVNKLKRSGVDKFEDIYKDLLPIFADDLKEMILICKQNNIVPIVIKYPTRDYNSKGYIETINIIQNVCKENKTYLLNCSSFFESLDPESRAEYFTDTAHLTDKGNEKIAQIIYTILIDNFFIH